LKGAGPIADTAASRSSSCLRHATNLWRHHAISASASRRPPDSLGVHRAESPLVINGESRAASGPATEAPGRELWRPPVDPSRSFGSDCRFPLDSPLHTFTSLVSFRIARRHRALIPSSSRCMHGGMRRRSPHHIRRVRSMGASDRASSDSPRPRENALGRRHRLRGWADPPSTGSGRISPSRVLAGRCRVVGGRVAGENRGGPDGGVSR
jgi:hypothetical protein